MAAFFGDPVVGTLNCVLLSQWNGAATCVDSQHDGGRNRMFLHVETVSMKMSVRQHAPGIRFLQPRNYVMNRVILVQWWVRIDFSVSVKADGFGMNRRLFLRQAGVAIGLPFLPSLTSSQIAIGGQQVVSGSKKMVCIGKHRSRFMWSEKWSFTITSSSSQCQRF